MKLRWVISIIVLLSVSNYLRINTNGKLNQFVAAKIEYAIDYYMKQAQNYYLQLTGQIPPPLVNKHFREWRQFGSLCDALILDSDKSLQLFTIYLDSLDYVRRQRSPKPTNKGGKFDRDRFEQHFKKFHQKMVKRFEEKLKDQLPEKEIKVVDTVLAMHPYIPDAELRALRFVSLQDEQRDQLLPYSIKMIQNILSPWLKNHRLAFEQNEIPESEETKEKFIAKVKEILTPAQQKSWEAKKKEISQEIKNFHDQWHPYNSEEKQDSDDPHEISVGVDCPCHLQEGGKGETACGQPLRITALGLIPPWLIKIRS